MRRLVLVTTILSLTGLYPSARADERYLDFINRLQEHGYHDLVVEYVEQIRRRPSVPDDVKVLAEYYIGKGKLAGSESVADLSKRDEQLQAARPHFEKFIQEQSGHERVPEAQMELAQILVERGRVAVLQSENPNNLSRRSDLIGQARSLLDAAKNSFAGARDRFAAEYKKFPAFIPEDQKRQREVKSMTQVNLMQAELHLGLVEYEVAQTQEKSSNEYKNTLRQAVALFEIVRTQYRFLLGGQYARMWQGKCYEEMGELGKAEGIYKELAEHEDKDSSMQALQRQVEFFQIILLNKRGDHIIAADMAKKWLQRHASQRRNPIGLGVQFEMAKGLIEQTVPQQGKNPDRTRMLSQAMDALAEVARYDTIYKQPAILLQQKYKGLVGTVGSVLTYDKALALGDEASNRNAWPEATEYYSHALKLAKDNLETDQLALVRYKLSFGHFQTKNYYAAAVLGEYVARYQRESAYAAPAAHVAMEALARAFNDVEKAQQSSTFEENRIARLVEYVTSTWPTAPEANAGRFLLGELHVHQGRFEAAGQVYESVSSSSPDYAKALGRSGDAYWRVYVDGATKPREEREPEKMADALKRARENLAKGVAEQVKNLKPDAPLSVELAESEINLAEVSIESGQPADAVKLMQELAPKIETQKDLKPLELRALIALLRGCVVTKDLHAAEDTMKSIESTRKDLAQITRVYLDLGKQLQGEMGRLQALGDKLKYEITRDSYVSFLNQMASRREGQTFLTLEWTGEAFFGLEMYDQAAARFGEIVNRSLSDPKFLDQSNPQNRAALTQSKLRRVTAVRKQGRFSEAWELIKPLPPQSNTGKDPLHEGLARDFDIIMERGLVLQEWGDKEPKRLDTAINHWAYWGREMDKLAQKPTQYFELRVNMIRSLLKRARNPADAKDREQRLRQAEQQLLFLTKTSTALGGPALKTQFKQLQRELEKELGRPIGESPPTATVKPAGN